MIERILEEAQYIVDTHASLKRRNGVLTLIKSRTSSIFRQVPVVSFD